YLTVNISNLPHLSVLCRNHYGLSSEENISVSPRLFILLITAQHNYLIIRSYVVDCTIFRWGEWAYYWRLRHPKTCRKECNFRIWRSIWGNGVFSILTLSFCR